jgi:hypothetical protein
MATSAPAGGGGIADRYMRCVLCAYVSRERSAACSWPHPHLQRLIDAVTHATRCEGCKCVHLCAGVHGHIHTCRGGGAETDTCGELCTYVSRESS